MSINYFLRKQNLLISKVLTDFIRTDYIEYLKENGIAYPAAFLDESRVIVGVGIEKRFLEKYGKHRLIPIIELLQDETGLGNPYGYSDTSSPPFL